MKKLLGRLVVLGALAGAAVAARNYLNRSATAGEVAQIHFDDNSSHVLTADSADGEELTNLARQLVEGGV